METLNIANSYVYFIGHISIIISLTILLADCITAIMTKLGYVDAKQHKRTQNKMMKLFYVTLTISLIYIIFF